VLYIGTFSKTMFPSLRLGFLVLPEALLASVQAPLEEMLRGGHRHEQLAMADFIESGQFGRHLGRMRRLYRDRQQALRLALTRHLKVPHEIDGGYCGLHLTVRLPPASTTGGSPPRRCATSSRPWPCRASRCSRCRRTTGWCWVMAIRRRSFSSRWSSGCRNWRGLRNAPAHEALWAPGYCGRLPSQLSKPCSIAARTARVRELTSSLR
jgi:hypothetical protein